MTNSIKMPQSISAPLSDGLPVKTAGSLSMISVLAISVGMAAAPAQAQAQDITIPGMSASPAPVQAAPVLSPQPAPAAEPAPIVTPTRVDDLASKGGFDAATVAPEALAQIESEQQARKDAAAAAAAKSAAAARAAAAKPARTSAPLTSASTTDSATPAAPAFDADGSAALAEGTADSVAVIPMIAPVPELASAPEAIPADGETDWSLLAALAGMLGIGSAGAYAATRRRKSKTRQTAARDAAIMPELRRDSVKAEIGRTMDAAQPPIQPTVQAIESKASTKVAFTDFVANLPAFEAPLGKANPRVKNGQLRVAAAPRPYLGEADLSRPEGYFTANVGSMPTPQNPFLTRQNRVKRARYLDAKLAERKASTGESRTRMGGEMQASRPLEPAFA